MNPIVGIDWLAAPFICASAAGAAYQLVAARAVQRFAARTTVDLGDRYAIEPAFAEYTRAPFAAPRLAEDLSYASDTNHEWLSGAALLALLGEAAPSRRRRLTDA